MPTMRGAWRRSRSRAKAAGKPSARPLLLPFFSTTAQASPSSLSLFHLLSHKHTPHSRLTPPLHACRYGGEFIFENWLSESVPLATISKFRETTDYKVHV